MYYFKYFFANLVDFRGVASRREFWCCQLMEFICLLILAVTIIGFIAYPVVLLGQISLCVRRLHDINWNGLLMLLTIIPFVGIFVYVIGFIPTKIEGNNYRIKAAEAEEKRHEDFERRMEESLRAAEARKAAKEAQQG